jgi:hypothetical protein
MGDMLQQALKRSLTTSGCCTCLCCRSDKMNLLVRALEKIACRHVTEAPLWWQKEARDALVAVSTPGEPK